MTKRRYSEDFYSEIDTLIKIHQEKSVKRFEMIEVAQSKETSDGSNKTKYGYTPPPTFWEVASSNKLLKYALIFIGILFATFLLSVTLSGRIEQNRKLAAGDRSIVHSAESKEKPKKESGADLSSSHETLNVSVKPVPASWGDPQTGMLKPHKDDVEKLKDIKEKTFHIDIPEESASPIPDIIDKNNETSTGTLSTPEDTDIK